MVQLYVSAPGQCAPKPTLELRAFAKTRTLQPGESQALGFRLTGRELASFDEATSSWLAEAGSYTLKVGASSTDIRQSAGFVLTRPRTVDSVAASIGSLGAR